MPVYSYICGGGKLGRPVSTAAAAFALETNMLIICSFHRYYPGPRSNGLVTTPIDYDAPANIKNETKATRGRSMQVSFPPWYSSYHDTVASTRVLWFIH
jgi:hypothetical protein